MYKLTRSNTIHVHDACVAQSAPFCCLPRRLPAGARPSPTEQKVERLQYPAGCFFFCPTRYSTMQAAAHAARCESFVLRRTRRLSSYVRPRATRACLSVRAREYMCVLSFRRTTMRTELLVPVCPVFYFVQHPPGLDGAASYRTITYETPSTPTKQKNKTERWSRRQRYGTAAACRWNAGTLIGLACGHN